MVPKPSAPLPLWHRYRLLLSHLPGLNPSINCAAGNLISEMVKEVSVELREMRIKNKHVWEKK